MNRSILLLPALALVACTDVDSADLLTSGMHASITGVAKGDGTTTVDVVLRAGGATSTTFVQLTGDDQLTASVDGGDPVELNHYELADYHGYSATLSNDSPDATFEVAFVRTVDDGAPSSTFSLPEPFDIGELPQTASRAEDLTITWTPSGSGETMTIEVAGTCFQGVLQNIDDDPGTYTIPAGTMQTIEDAETDTCDAVVILWRHEEGAADPAYGEGGFATGRQRREKTISSTP